MAITLNLPPDIEAKLAAQARELGLQLDTYVQSVLQQQAAMEDSLQTLNLEQFEVELDALAEGSDRLPYLPPEALTRASIYRDHD
ncbi:MAG: hypothetical protein ABSE79_02465 [Terriglobia bacterium]|jgi:hypothetical protein